MTARIIDILEKQEFRVFGTHGQDGEFYTELEWCSPAGEDFIATVWHKSRSDEDFTKGFREYAEAFDPDEHAELWCESRGKNGVPSSIRVLIDDADAIKEHLAATAKLLQG